MYKVVIEELGTGGTRVRMSLGPYIGEVNYHVGRKSWMIELDKKHGAGPSYDKVILAKDGKKEFFHSKDLAMKRLSEEILSRVCTKNYPIQSAFIAPVKARAEYLKECECGAKHTSRPNHHSDWCELYKGE